MTKGERLSAHDAQLDKSAWTNNHNNLESQPAVTRLQQQREDNNDDDSYLNSIEMWQADVIRTWLSFLSK